MKKEKKDEGKISFSNFCYLSNSRPTKISYLFLNSKNIDHVLGFFMWQVSD